MTLQHLLRRTALAAGLFGVLAAAMAGCGGGSSPGVGVNGGGNNGGTTGGTGPGPGLSDPPDISRAACTANAHVNGRTRWTVLVYINSANNLQPDSLLNVGQMASVGSDSNVNIVLQWKQAQCVDCGQPSFFGTRRYLLKPHSSADVTAIMSGNTTSLDADRLADPATNDSSKHQSDMGSFLTLQNFVQWGSQNFPADHLALVVWDHGSGWRNVFRSAGNSKLASANRAVSQDNDTNDEIETWELPTALSILSKPLDMLIVDCSLEMMAEVAYEVRNNARVMVGSEESPPGAGYVYDQWLKALKSSGTDPCNVGDSILTTFIAAYPQATDITQAVVDLSKMTTVATALDAFGSSLLAHASDQATVIANARNNAQSYAFPENKDLYHYADLIRTTTTAADLQKAAFNLEASLRGKGAAIIYQGHGSLAQANSFGMAVYVPEPTTFLATYNTLALTHAAPHWAQFLQAQKQ
jgi:hypothetical protein